MEPADLLDIIGGDDGLPARDCPLASAIQMNLEVPALYARYLGAWFGGFPNDRSLGEE